MSDILLQVEHLTKQFLDPSTIRSECLKDVVVRLEPFWQSFVTPCLSLGETVAIVGESGCGKSTLVKTVLSMHKPTEGKVIFDGKDTTNLHSAAQRDYYRHIQMVFQDFH